MVGINSAKAFSSPGAIVRAKDSRAFRPDSVFPSSFPARHSLTVSRVLRTGEDEELRTSSDSFRLRSASKSNTPDLICVAIREFAGPSFRLELTLSSSTRVSRVVTHETNSSAGMMLNTEFKQIRAVLSISGACFSFECAFETAEIWIKSGKISLARPSAGSLIRRRA